MAIFKSLQKLGLKSLTQLNLDELQWLLSATPFRNTDIF